MKTEWNKMEIMIEEGRAAAVKDILRILVGLGKLGLHVPARVERLFKEEDRWERTEQRRTSESRNQLERDPKTSP